MQRRFLLAVLVLLVLIAAVLYGQRFAARSREARLKSLSAAELQAIISKDSANNEARYRLGLAYARENRLQEAVKEFLAVLDVDPVRHDVLNDLGVAYLLQGRYNEALYALQGALKAKPEFAAGHANLGRLYVAAKMPFSAVRSLEKAAELDPRNLPTLIDLGEAHQQTLNMKSAVAVFEKAVALDPKSVPARVGLGKALYGLAEYSRAETSLLEALKLSPDDGTALVTLARLRIERGANGEQLKEIRKMLETAAAKDPYDPESRYDLGRLAMREKRPQDALEFFNATLRISPEHNGALFQTERALRLLGRVEEADRWAKAYKARQTRDREITRLETTLERHPDDLEARVKLAKLYMNARKLDLARLVVKQIEDRDRAHPELPAMKASLAAAEQMKGGGPLSR